MKSSDSICSRAAQIIDQLTSLLDESNLSRKIDEPIDKAVEELLSNEDSEFSIDRFHREISGLVRAIYGNALPCSRKLSPSHAHDEAISLLESAYRGAFADGYYGAILDASDPTQPGLSLVLVKMVEMIKARQKQTYVRWVGSRLIDPADWPTQCAIAAILIKRYARWLPLEIQKGPPDRYADLICELLAMNLATNSQLQQSPAQS